MSYCTLDENVIGNCPRCTKELLLLRGVLHAARRAGQLLQSSTIVAIPPEALSGLRQLALGEVAEALKDYDDGMLGSPYGGETKGDRT